MLGCTKYYKKNNRNIIPCESNSRKVPSNIVCVYTILFIGSGIDQSNLRKVENSCPYYLQLLFVEFPRHYFVRLEKVLATINKRDKISGHGIADRTMWYKKDEDGNVIRCRS